MPNFLQRESFFVPVWYTIRFEVLRTSVLGFLNDMCPFRTAKRIIIDVRAMPTVTSPEGSDHTSGLQVTTSKLATYVYVTYEI